MFKADYCKTKRKREDSANKQRIRDNNASAVGLQSSPSTPQHKSGRPKNVRAPATPDGKDKGGRPIKVRRSDVHVLHEVPSKEAETSSESEGAESAENAAASAHIKELIAELEEMFPAPDAVDLQADFLEYRNTLRRKCTLRTCCSCGENHSLDDMVLDQSKMDAEALDFAGSSVFPPIAEFVFLQNPSGQSGLHICLRCFPDLKRGKRPHRAYHFGTPDPQLSCLNPHELRLVKPLVQVYQLRRLFGAGGSVQYGMTGIVASFENDSARVAARLPRLPSQSSTAYLVRKSAHTGLPLRELIRPELVRTAVMWACGVNADGQAAAAGCPHIGFLGIKWDPDAADTIQRACDDPSTEPGEQPVVVEQDEEEGEEETPSGGHHDAVLITREGGGRSEVEVIAEGLAPLLPPGREGDVLRRLARGEISISDASPPEINQADVQPRFSTLANDFMGDALWAMLFCELLPGGLGGPATTGMDLDTWIDHCLRYHDGRFAECIDFIFFCYSLKQRKKLNGIVATAARTRSGRAAGGGGDEDVDLTANQQAPSVDDLRLAAAALADAVSPPDAGQQQRSADPSVAAALEEGRKTLKLLSVYSKTFEGTAAQMMRSRRELLAMIQSGHCGTPVYFGTTAAADVEGWPEIFHMIGAHRIKKRFASITALASDIDGIIAQLTKEQCATLVKENPVIVIRHYRDRFNALWDHILCGKAKPLGEISDYWRRDDAQQRGSFHTHMLIFIKWLSESGRMAELMESEEGRAALLRMFDARISAWYSQLPPGYTEEGIAVQELQDAIRRSLQAEGPDDPRPCPVCGTGDDGDSAFLLCSSCNDPIGHETCIMMSEGADISKSAHAFCNTCVDLAVWSAPPTARGDDGAPPSVEAVVLPAEVDDGVVLARTRPSLDDFAGPARRPHGSFTGEDGKVAFYLRPCRVKVFLADGNLPQPNQCGNSCPRCSPSSAEFVQSAHVPITAEAATQAFTADGLAHWRGVQNAFQWHHCCFTCWKYRKRGQISCPCRFKFPFALQDKSCFAVERSQQTGRCARSFRARRNHPYLNATCPVVAVAWGGNSDWKPITDGKGSARYATMCANYSSRANKPDQSLYQRRLMTSIKRLPAGCDFKKVFSSRAYAIHGSEEVSAQHAAKTLLHDHKFVRCSREFVHFNLYPAIEQNVNIAAASIAAAAADSGPSSVAPLPTKPFSQQSLLECYRTRCTGPLGQSADEIAPGGVEGAGGGVTWRAMWLDHFLGHFKMHSGPLPKGEGLRWRMGNGLYVMLHHKQAVVVSTPFISADVRENERAAYAAILLFRPHSSREGVMTLGDKVYSSAVHLLDTLPREELAEDGWSQITRVEQTAEESRELEEMCRRQDDASHALPEGGEDDDQGPTFLDVEPTTYKPLADDDGGNAQPSAGLQGDAARAAGIFLGSHSDIARARSFVHDQHANRQQSLDAEMREFDDAISDATQHVGSGLPNQDVAEQRFNPKHVEKLKALHSKANEEQLTFLDSVHTGVVETDLAKQVLAILSGAGGTGKSTVIEAAALFTRMMHGSRSVLLAAPTNGAASIIQGVTINKAFRLSCYGVSRIDPSKATGLATLTQERDRLSKVKLLIVDEMSLFGLRLLAVIIEYFRMVFRGTERQNLPFGGIPVVVFAGDFYQLPPVKQQPMYRDPPADAPPEQHAARALFKKSFKVFIELTHNYRHKLDPFWADMCMHARFHTAPSPFDLARINARPRLTTTEALLTTPGALRSDALFTAWTRREVAEINATALAACNQRGKATFTIWATHSAPLRSGGGRGSRGGGRRGGGRGGRGRGRGGGGGANDDCSDDDEANGDGGPAPRDAQAALQSALSQTIDPLVLGRLMRYNPNISDDGSPVDTPGFRPPPSVKLAVGSRVRLAITDSVILGLTKGAQGSVFGFYFARDGPAPVPNASLRALAEAGRNPPWGVPIVLVQWDDRYYRGESFIQGVPRVTPVTPLAFEVRLDGERWTRCMVPLVPATASTIHSAQGMGTDEHVMSPPEGGPGSLLYVQMSRSTTLAGTYVTAPLTATLFTRGAQSDEFRAVQTEYERLRKLPKWKRSSSARADMQLG